jgi:hypothetical protein
MWSNVKTNPIITRHGDTYEITSAKYPKYKMVLKGSSSLPLATDREKLAREAASHEDVLRVINMYPKEPAAFDEKLPTFSFQPGAGLKKYVAAVVSTTKLYPEFKAAKDMAFHKVM